MKNNMQKGFTLIELMIVVAIIGILASIAIPQYQNYIAKSQMTRVVGELSALKTAAETLLMEGTSPSTAEELGFAGSDLLGQMPANAAAIEDMLDVAFDVNGAGSIEGTMAGSSSTSVRNVTVVVSRSAAGSWTCALDTSNATTGWKDEFAPKGCPVSN